MSRIGSTPVKIPSGVEASVDGNVLKVKGPKGELTREFTGGITASIEDGLIKVERSNDEKQSKALHGMYRSKIAGMVEVAALTRSAM